MCARHFFTHLANDVAVERLYGWTRSLGGNARLSKTTPCTVEIQVPGSQWQSRFGVREVVTA